MPDIAKINVVIGADVQPLNAGIEAAKSKISSFSNSSNQATLALSNLSRVAQDAPYGFIGIANNLNPLLESFQRLKVTAGSNVGALKALGASLTGAGGIGLALGIASSLLVVFSQQMQKTSSAVDAAKESADEFKQAVKGIGEESAKELTRVRELVTGFNSENTSRLQKIGIINELKKINPTYFGQLDAEKTSVDLLKTAYDNYNGSIQNTIKAKIYSKELEGLVNTELKLGEAVDRTKFLLDARNKSNKTGFTDPGATALANSVLETQKKITVNLERQEFLKTKIDALGGVLKTDTEVKTLTKDLNTLNEELVLLRRNLKFPDTIAIDVPDMTGVIQRSLDKGPGLIIDVRTVRQKEQSDKDFQNAFLSKAYEQKHQSSIEQYNKRLEKQQQLAASIKDTFANMFREIQTGGKNAFQILGEAVQRLVVQLISAVAQTLILKLIMTAITGGAGAGLSLPIPHEAFGGGGRIAHAEGGIFTGPTQIGSHLFGEAGPEALIPLSRMNEMGGAMGSNMNISGMLKMSGNDLVLVMNRNNVKIGRNYGTNFN